MQQLCRERGVARHHAQVSRASRSARWRRSPGEWAPLLWYNLPAGHWPARLGGRCAIIPDNPNWRRFRHACPHYREHWTADELADADGRPLLYQIICLQNTPPVSADEQQRCMQARKKCWRLGRKRGSGGESAGDPAAAEATQAEAAEPAEARR